MNIDENIKKYRLLKKITRKDLAKELQVSESTISRYENGKREPNFETLNKIAKALDCDLSLLIGLDESLEQLDFQASILEKHLGIAEAQKERQKEMFDNLTEKGIGAFLHDTVHNIMFLAIESTDINYDIDNFNEQELTEIGDFLYNAYTLKVNEILEKHKNTKDNVTKLTTTPTKNL